MVLLLMSGTLISKQIHGVAILISNPKTGFTIVELLIVIVIIAILAAIAIVTYQGILARGRDANRVSSLDSIEKGLGLYKAVNDSYPTSVPNPGLSTWEVSTDPGFLSSLSAQMSRIPLDPINDSTHMYRYHTFAAGSSGCSAALGPYYVLWARGMETQTQTYLDTGPCTGQTLFPMGFLQTTDRVIYRF